MPLNEVAQSFLLGRPLRHGESQNVLLSRDRTSARG